MIIFPIAIAIVGSRSCCSCCCGDLIAIDSVGSRSGCCCCGVPVALGGKDVMVTTSNRNVKGSMQTPADSKNSIAVVGDVAIVGVGGNNTSPSREGFVPSRGW